MSNSEKITVSSHTDHDTVKSVDRDEHYNQVFSSDNSADSLAVHIVNVFIVNSDRQILLQKRSPTKRHNAGLIDKSLGGHIVFGDKADYSVMVETVQELLTPSIVLRSDADFKRTYGLLKDYDHTVAIIKSHDTRLMQFERSVEKEKYPVTNVVHLYFGVYNGSTRPADREAAGILYYTLEDLKHEMAEMPQIFTDDLKQLIEHYGSDLESFIKQVT